MIPVVTYSVDPISGDMCLLANIDTVAFDGVSSFSFIGSISVFFYILGKRTRKADKDDLT